MSQDYTKPEFKELLKRLQEESWQLELLISGFAIFGLITTFPYVQKETYEAINAQQLYKGTIFGISLISCSILIFNLLLHVFLRGIWIGALGLRYVSGDIDYDSLKYSQRFTKYLKKRVGSFDKYIATLEDYCSVIFAISFLLIFYVLAITFTILVIILIATQIIGNDNLPNWLSSGVGITLQVFISIGMILTFIDFITLGFLKRKKWLSFIYFPVYWVFSFITLSFLYRPLVYNFLDNKFGKRLSFALIPFYIVIALTLSLNYKSSNYFNSDTNSSEIVANNNNYDDLVKENGIPDQITIQSKVITDAFVKIHVGFSENIENRIFNFNPSLKPKNDNRGLKIFFSSNDWSNFSKRDSIRKEYIKTFNSIYSIRIDSTNYKTEFVFIKSDNDERYGFETFISTNKLNDGKHLLKLNRLRIRKGDTSNLKISTIPFWYFKD